MRSRHSSRRDWAATTAISISPPPTRSPELRRSRDSAQIARLASDKHVVARYAGKTESAFPASANLERRHRALQMRVTFRQVPQRELPPLGHPIDVKPRA